MEPCCRRRCGMLAAPVDHRKWRAECRTELRTADAPRHFPVWPRPVEDWRAAFATEAAFVATRLLVILDQMLAVQPTEIFDLRPSAAAERCSVLLSAQRAMAVEWT